MYYLEIENKFTEEQSKKAIEYSKSNRGERYGYLSIIAYIPFVSNFLAKYFNVSCENIIYFESKIPHVKNSYVKMIIEEKNKFNDKSFLV